MIKGNVHWPRMLEWEDFMERTADYVSSAGANGDAATRKNWITFHARVRDRMANGARQYKEASFERPLWELLNEAMQEPEDVAGWSFIMSSRLLNMGPDARKPFLVGELASMSAQAFALWARLCDLYEMFIEVEDQEKLRRQPMSGQ